MSESFSLAENHKSWILMRRASIFYDYFRVILDKSINFMRSCFLNGFSINLLSACFSSPRNNSVAERARDKLIKPPFHYDPPLQEIKKETIRMRDEKKASHFNLCLHNSMEPFFVLCFDAFLLWNCFTRLRTTLTELLKLACEFISLVFQLWGEKTIMG